MDERITEVVKYFNTHTSFDKVNTLSDWYVLQLTDSGDDGDRESDLNDITLLTRKLIAALPEKQRLALELRDVEGYEIYEIAAIVESDETSVRMNLSRARKSIREQLIKALNHGVSRD